MFTVPRPAVPREAAAIVDLVNPAYTEAEGGLWASADFQRTNAEEVSGLIASGQMLVAVDPDGSVVGCIRWHLAPGVARRVAEFGMLAVKPSSRRAGLGRRLIRGAEALAVQAGCEAIQCELLVPAEGGHANKDKMRGWYTEVLGYALDAPRTRDFCDVYGSLTQTFPLACACNLEIYSKELAPASPPAPAPEPPAAAPALLYGRTSSLNTQRVLWCLAEVGRCYRLVPTSATLGASGGLGSPPLGGVDEPSFVACSPFRQIPALRDGEAALWESASITRYLASTYAHGGALAGRTAAEHAAASAWMDYHLSTFAAGGQIYGPGDFMGVLMTQLVRLPKGDGPFTLAAHGGSTLVRRDAAALAAAAGTACREWAKLDRHLREARTLYFCGDALTIADIPLGAEYNRWAMLRALLRAGEHAAPIGETPALDEWHARLRERPAFLAGVVAPEEEHHRACRAG